MVWTRKLMRKEESGWDWVDWTKLAGELERTENDSDRGMNLGMPSESGSDRLKIVSMSLRNVAKSRKIRCR